MFSDDFSENWNSTVNQDIFIKEYFGKAKLQSKSNQNVSIQAGDLQNSYSPRNEAIKKNHDIKEGDVAYTSTQIKQKSSLNNEVKKRIQKSGSAAHYIVNENYSDSMMKDLHTTDIKSQKLKKKRKRSKKKKKVESEQQSVSSYDEISEQINETEEVLSESESTGTTGTSLGNNYSVQKSSQIQNKCFQKLQAAKFRYLNEMLYTNAGKEALSYFQENTEEFQDYHVGYQSQVSKWPINPVNIIIQEISQMNKQVVIADLGCGEAKIAEVFPKRTVHSFDLIPLKDCVTPCDIAHVPLPNNSIDVAVFCLSLMGTNWKDYIIESHRILKLGAVLKIAEIESRIEELELFIKNIEHYGFSLVNKNVSHKMFIFLNFEKKNRKRKKGKVTNITLKPCLYKKR